MRTIEEIHAGRDLISAKDVMECILVKTGLSISINTIAAWRGMEMPGAIQPPGQRYWRYDWSLIWPWYLTYTENQKKKRFKSLKKEI